MIKKNARCCHRAFFLYAGKLWKNRCEPSRRFQKSTKTCRSIFCSRNLSRHRVCYVRRNDLCLHILLCPICDRHGANQHLCPRGGRNVNRNPCFRDVRNANRNPCHRGGQTSNRSPCFHVVQSANRNICPRGVQSVNLRHCLCGCQNRDRICRNVFLRLLNVRQSHRNFGENLQNDRTS